MPLPPGGSTLYRSGIEIENSTYRSAMAMDFQFMPMRVRPFLLLGGSHPYPEQIRICLVDSFDYRPIVLFRKLRLIGWRIGFHFDVGIIHFHTLFYQCQYFFTAAHEKHFPPIAFSLFISNSNRFQPAIRSVGLDLAFSQRHALTILAPSGINTSPCCKASAKSLSFWAVL